MDIVVTPFLQGIIEQALRYLRCGLPVHFCGPAGTGKTTLALHVAGLLGRPVTVLRGDEELTTSGLVGGAFGLRHRRVVDNFIRSVLKVENEILEYWQDERLTEACREGHVLVYDEFTRSRPEANNVLLSVLEEGVLPLPGESGCNEVSVHPEFRAVFTSNPEEYAGVHKAQDALRDRMVTIRLDHCDAETETAIVAVRSGLPEDRARRVVSLVRQFREQGETGAGLRAGIFLARFVQAEGIDPDPADERFRRACLDVLGPAAAGTARWTSSWRDVPGDSPDDSPASMSSPACPDEPDGGSHAPVRTPVPARPVPEVGEAGASLLRRKGEAGVSQW